MKYQYIFAISLFSATSFGEDFGGVTFPGGVTSFADKIVSYTQGSNVSAPYNNSGNVLGVPDYVSGGEPEYTSLGDQGELVVQFTNNSLTTSGNSDFDLWIFEIGTKLEPTEIFISKDGSNWISVGATTGGTGGIDIDAYINQGVVLGESYQFAKVVDLLPVQSGSPWAGADIDAIGAISSTHGPCGDQNTLEPASYDKQSGDLIIHDLVIEDKCYSLQLKGTENLDIDQYDVFIKTSFEEQ